MSKLITTLTVTAGMLLISAPAAFAHDGGEGWWGETNDLVITMAGFVLIIFFPLFVLVMSLIQWKLDKRKAQRKADRKRLDKLSGW